jgi:phosphatidylserine decarboxylase
MLNHWRTYLQHVIPQHLLTRFAGLLANAKTPWLKNHLIRRFIRDYSIDLSDAKIKDPTAYACFNDFFIRQLNASARPITNTPNSIASPADGAIAQVGQIEHQQLLQAKGHYFNLETLLGNDAETAAAFHQGSFATIYLAPQDYHRVHMPLDGELVKSIYVPGRLFSVNQQTAAVIPNIYARNERLICLFNTQAGPMAVILVGAMIVGSIQTTWMDNPIRGNKLITMYPSQPVHLKKGDELGHFKLGSTVIMLFPKQSVHWQDTFTQNARVKVGAAIGSVMLR